MSLSDAGVAQPVRQRRPSTGWLVDGISETFTGGVTAFRDGSFTRGWTPRGPRFVEESEISELAF